MNIPEIFYDYRKCIQLDKITSPKEYGEYLYKRSKRKGKNSKNMIKGKNRR